MAGVRAVLGGLAGELLPISRHPRTPTILLGAGGYDRRPISAPRAAGARLRLLAWLLTSRWSFFRRWLRRHLLNKNQPHLVRELAVQIGPGVPAVFHPTCVCSAAAHAEHARLAAGADGAAALKASGWLDRLGTRTPSHAIAYWSVEDYAQAYRSQRVTPCQVAEVVLAGIHELDG
jgi:hypothetical protein